MSTINEVLADLNGAVMRLNESLYDAGTSGGTLNERLRSIQSASTEPGSGSGAEGSTFVPTIPALNDMELAELGKPSFEYHPEFFLTSESTSAPAVVGDVVSGWNSIGEADNISYGLSSTSGNRPTLRQDSIGLPYLDFSGSKYFTQTAGISQFASGKFTLVIVCSFNSVTADTFPFSFGAASGFPGYLQCRIDSSTLLRNSLNDGSNTYTVGLGGISTVIPEADKKCIIMIVHTTDKQYMYFAQQDGDVQEIDCGNGLGAASMGIDTFAISGRILNGSVSAQANLNVYHVAGWAGKACYDPLPVMHTLGNAYRMNLGTSPVVRVPKPTHVWHFGDSATTHIDIVGGADVTEDGSFNAIDAEFSGEDNAITPGAGTLLETASVFTSLGARENTSVTYMARIRLAASASQKIMGTWATGAQDWLLDTLSTREIRFRRSDSTNVRTLQSNNPVPTATWVIVVWGYDADNTQLFMRIFGADGTDSAEKTETNANLATPYSTGSQDELRFFKDNAGGVTFSGGIHWAAVWYGRKLTLDQINEAVTGRFFASEYSQSRPPFKRV